MRVGRWRDFYGSHDPAPFARPSDLDPATAPAGDAAIEITNLRSIRDDHGAYWANDESFVLPVMTEIERAAGTGTVSRFGRDDPGRSDRDGVRRRESRVAMRSLWGRLALVGPLVAILFAAGITAGDIGQAAVLDAPSDILAANYDVLPFHELGASLHAWTVETVPLPGQDLAGRLTRGLAIVLIAIAAMWAFIPVGGWSRLPAGAAIADALTSAVVPVAAWAAFFGLGAIPGVDLPPDARAIAAVVVGIVIGSYTVYRWRAEHSDRRIPATLVSTVIMGGVIVAFGAGLITFIVDDEARRWVVDVAFAVIAVRLVVSLGMWRWNAWDAAERQWFRGGRSRPSSRVAIYVIAVLLGLLVVAVVAALGGLEGPLRASGAPFVEYLTPAAVLGGAILVLVLIVRDVSIAESVRD